MKRKIAVVWLSLMMVLGFIVVVDTTMDFIPSVKGDILYVNTTGGVGVYTKIQDAINDSKDGDTVFVYSGTYNERIIVNKTINLIGEDMNVTIIDGGGWDDIITVITNWVNITGFALNNSGYTTDDAGIELDHVKYCRILNNTFLGEDNSIYLYHSNYINISYNALLCNRIRLRDSNNSIFYGNYGSGDLFSGWIYNSNYNKFINNDNISLSLSKSIGYKIIGNTFLEQGISISGNLVEHWNTHTIDTSNTIEGKPIFYLKNQTGGIVPSGGAHIILAKCIDSLIENQEIMHGRTGIQLGFCSNTTVTNITLSSLSLGIRLSHSNGSMINYNNASNMEMGISLSYSEGNNVSNNFVFNNSYEGLGTGAGSHNTFFNNTITHNGYSGISCSGSNNSFSYNDISYNGEGLRFSSATNNSIFNNTITYNGDESGLAFGVGLFIISSSENAIFNNTITHNGFPFSMFGYGVYLDSSSNNSIHNNNILSNLMNGLVLESSDNNQIFNNNIYDDFACGISIGESNNNSIFDNDIWFTSYGIDISASVGNSIIGNSIWDSASGIWIRSDSDYNVISDNGIGGNGGGVYIESYSNNTISDNYVSFNGYGLGIFDHSNDNKIINNHIDGNEYNGIGLSSNSNRNTIVKNSVSDHSDYGIYISGSYDNRIYYNNIQDNTNQAYDDTNNGNQWDNGYPWGGNYWSDYSGSDNFKGPLQNILGKDSIGDTPYIIDADSQDNYPLMAPYKPLENFTVLMHGWNLISIPLIQDEKDLTMALGSIDSWYDTVEFFNISNKNDHWKINNMGKPFGNDLSEITEKLGFWIHITNPGETIFLYNGTQPTENQTINLLPGWNMVGYPSTTNYNRTQGLNNLTFGTHVDSIWTFNTSSQRWQKIGESDYFEVGRGYWIHAKTKCEWEVPL